MKAPRTVVGRGVLAGAVAATVLVIWFLIVDLQQGAAFRTPAFLAGALGLADGDGPMSTLGVLLYTLVHYAAFAVVGVGAAWLAERLEAVPALALGLALGFLLFNVVFYGSVWVTGIDVVQGLGGWPVVLIGNLLAGVALFGALTAMGAAEPMNWSRIVAEHWIVREGVITGLIGAAAVAVWFLVVDAASGRLLFTPAALGSAVFLGARGSEAVQVTPAIIGGYTLLHLTAFVLTGLIAAGIVAAAEEYTEAVLLGGVLLFMVLEAFSIGILTIVAQWLVNALSWWNIGVANLVAALAMGGYLMTRHPKLVRDIKKRDLEEDLAQSVVGSDHATHLHK